MAADPSASFSQHLWRTFRTRWLVATLLNAVFLICVFLQPFWLGALLEWMADKADGRAVAGHNYLMGASTGTRALLMWLAYAICGYMTLADLLDSTVVVLQVTRSQQGWWSQHSWP
jgi:hypothetical protein